MRSFWDTQYMLVQGFVIIPQNEWSFFLEYISIYVCLENLSILIILFSENKTDDTDGIKTEIDIEETRIVIDEPTDDNIDAISECEERHEMKIEDVDPLALRMDDDDSGNSLINNSDAWFLKNIAG